MTRTPAPQPIDLYLGFYPVRAERLPLYAEVQPGVRIGLHEEGLFAFAAAPVEELPRINYGGFPEVTATGIVCGACSDALTEVVRHASVAHVRACAAATEEAAAQQAAEIWAEDAWLRYAEGGWDVTGAYSAEPWQEGRYLVG